MTRKDILIEYYERWLARLVVADVEVKAYENVDPEKIMMVEKEPSNFLIGQKFLPYLAEKQIRAGDILKEAKEKKEIAQRFVDTIQKMIDREEVNDTIKKENKKEEELIELGVEMILKYFKAKETLMEDWKREPSSEEVAAEMGVKVEKINYIEKTIQNFQIVSLEGLKELIIKNENNNEIPEPIIENESVISFSTRAILREHLREILNDLTFTEQKILSMRFGLEDGVIHTLEEIGNKFDVDQEIIRQVEIKALEKIREHPDLKKLKGYF